MPLDKEDSAVAKNNTLSEFVSRVPQRWLMWVLLIFDIVTLLGVLVLNFSQLLKTNLILFWFIVAFVICMTTSVIFSYFAFRDVVKERNKYKVQPIDPGHEAILLNVLRGLQIEAISYTDQQFAWLDTSTNEVNLIGDALFWDAHINRTNCTVSIKLRIEDGIEWPCVLEHLNDVPLPDAFLEWKSAMEQDLLARLTLFDAVCKQIKESLGLPISDMKHPIKPSLSPFYAESLYEQVFCEVIGKSKGKRIRENFRFDSAGVILDNCQIIYSDNHQDSNIAIQFWIDSQTKLVELSESVNAKREYEAGQSKTNKFNREKQRVLTTARLPIGSKCHQCPNNLLENENDTTKT